MMPSSSKHVRVVELIRHDGIAHLNLSESVIYDLDIRYGGDMIDDFLASAELDPSYGNIRLCGNFRDDAADGEDMQSVGGYNYL